MPLGILLNRAIQKKKNCQADCKTTKLLVNWIKPAEHKHSIYFTTYDEKIVTPLADFWSHLVFSRL